RRGESSPTSPVCRPSTGLFPFGRPWVMARKQRRLRRSSRLAIEILESRAMPSTATPLDVAALDGAGLFDDPVFATAGGQGVSNRGAPGNPAAANAVGAPTQATPVVGSSVATNATAEPSGPAFHTAATALVPGVPMQTRTVAAAPTVINLMIDPSVNPT